MNANNSSEIEPMDDTALENLYQALFQCFAIIICGYVAGRQNLISNTEAKGLSTFVGTFSLPALIFMSMAELDLHSVNWMFLLSVLIAKSLVFVAVIIMTFLVIRPIHLGRAGLFAIFCTQSNDFAVGYPIVVALYSKLHPDYASYLYLMAPISLAILNPLGFVLMEIGKQQDASGGAVELTRRRSKFHMATSVAKNIVTNPVVFMTALGIIGNLIFSHHIPSLVSGLLEVLGKAFSAPALFLLGHRMVGKAHTLQGKALVLPGILIAVKLLALPLVTREVISLLNPGINASDSLDLSTYGFLYGTFPTAPGVFVFATQYALDVDLVASAMVACTFISAPFMFVSAKMVTVNKMKPSDYLQELDSFAFDISIIGIMACTWLLAMFIMTKKFSRLPHRITCCLVISQFIGCLGILLWSKLDSSQTWQQYVQFTLYTLGVYSSRLWTAFLAMSLLFLQCRSLCFVLKLQPYFIVLAWGTPLIIVTVLMCTQQGSFVEKRNPNFQFGETHTAITVFLLIFCIIVTVGSLVLHQRYQSQYAQYTVLITDINNQDISSDTENEIEAKEEDSSRINGCSHKMVADIEDLGNASQSDREMCPSSFNCPSTIREQCHSRIDRYNVQLEESEETEDQQILRHQVLLLLLVASMFIGIAFSIWTLIMEEMSGIYVELAFLDASLNFGQSLIVFATFGLDTKAVLLPLVKRWRKFWYRSPVVQLPELSDLSFETKHVCDQFVLHHLQKCKHDIARDKRCRLRVLPRVFAGSTLVDWLLRAQLARDRPEATQYASLLLDGRVLRHAEQLHHFHDRALLYTFD